MRTGPLLQQRKSFNRFFSADIGIHGSEMFAEMDLKAIKPYRILIKEVGQRHCIDPALIAAIISRESHGGAVLQNGWDHKGQRFGLMQVGGQRLYITLTSSLRADAQSPFQHGTPRCLGTPYSVTPVVFHSRQPLGISLKQVSRPFLCLF